MDDGYRPDEYKALTEVVEIHEKSWYRVSNEFSVKGNSPETDLYWSSLLIMPCFILGSLFVAVIAMVAMPCLPRCCNCICRRDTKARWAGFVAFVVAVSASCYYWALTISAKNTFDDLEEKFSTGLDLTMGQLGEWATSMDKLNKGFDVVRTNLTFVEGACADAVVEKMQSQLIREKLSARQDAVQVVRQVVSAANTALGAIRWDQESVKELETDNHFTALLLLLLLLFAGTTAVRFIFPKRTTRIPAKISSWLVFTVGLLVVSIFILVEAILHPLILIGSDLCVPSVDQNLQKVLSQIIGSPELATTEDFGVPLCQPIPDQSVSVDPNAPGMLYTKMLCYYQTCAGGENVALEFQDKLGQFQSDLQAVLNGVLEYQSEEKPCDSDLHKRVVEHFEDIVSLFQTSQLLDETWGAIEDALENQTDAKCHRALENTAASINLVARPALYSTGLAFKCSRVTPVYQSFIHEGVCHGIVHVADEIWWPFSLGSFFMVLSLFLYQMFRLGKPIVDVAVDQDWENFKKKTHFAYNPTTP